MRKSRKKDPLALARELMAALGHTEMPANDEEPEIDEAALRERARAAADRMRRARSR